MTKAFFITGCSSGFGLALAKAAAGRGHRVMATARHAESLESLCAEFPDQVVTRAVDVTNEVAVANGVAAANDEFGRIDVVSLNAGRGLLASFEETTDDQLRGNLGVNFLGPVHVLREIVPILRQQRSGVIVNISAIAALCNHPGFAVYGGAKAGVEALLDGLASELAPLGIKVMSVAPGPFRTEFIARSLDRVGTEIPEYASTVGKFGTLLNAINGKQAGDPAKAAELILDAALSERPPSRLILGKYACKQARQRLAQIVRELDEWEERSAATDF
jgi:NAD(P)-dependent dehydrogenase (short-subunit alcohol dehydrogenase family)